MRTLLATVSILCLLAAIGGGVVAVDPVTADTHDANTDAAADGDGFRTIEIEIEADGDANFSVYQRFAFENEEDRKAFDRLAERFESRDTEGAFSATVFERIAEGASEETGRQMAIENVDRRASAGENGGTLALEFRWTNFAATSEDAIKVGDAFTVDGERWLPSLSADQRLVIRTPEDYAVKNVTPEAAVNDDRVVWEGPQRFGSNEPAVRLVPSGRSVEDLSAFTVGLGLALVAAIVALIYLLSRRRGETPPREAGERDWASRIVPAREDGGEEPAEPAGTDGAGAGATGSTEPGDRSGGVDPELLSDEERVVRLLEANGGRMKQARIVTETDWSNAKVSQLLSSMAEEGRIEKLRIGRENLITLVEDES